MDPLKQIRAIRHGCVEFETEDGVVVYVDPYRIPDEVNDADLIIITHGHDDHYSPEDIARVRKSDTCFAAPRDVVRRLLADFELDRDYISELSYETPSTYFECGAMVTPVPAYNKNHPIESGFGCVLELGGVRHYLSGDTDVLADGADCDVLLVACDGIYNMPDFETRIPAEIADMDERPGLVIPYHYGDWGTQENGAKLCRALTAAGIRCEEFESYGE